MRIEGSSALVTGAASGLGAAAARRFASAGAAVTVVDLNDARGEAVASDVGGQFVRGDVTSPDDVLRAVDAAAGLAPLRVVVNCAGIGPPQRTINRDGTPHDLELFTKVIQINLIGTFNVIRIAAAAMAKQPAMDDNERGAIVNTASVAAFEGQVGQAAYSASKGGIVGLTLPVARDLARSGIRVNTIAPGLMDTPLLAGLPEEARISLAGQVLHPQRLGTPEEFAELALLLATHSYMNGSVVRMDGGIRMGPR